MPNNKQPKNNLSTAAAKEPTKPKMTAEEKRFATRFLSPCLIGLGAGLILFGASRLLTGHVNSIALVCLILSVVTFMCGVASGIIMLGDIRSLKKQYKRPLTPMEIADKVTGNIVELLNKNRKKSKTSASKTSVNTGKMTQKEFLKKQYGKSYRG